MSIVLNNRNFGSKSPCAATPRRGLTGFQATSNDRCSIGPADILCNPEDAAHQFENFSKGFALWEIVACSNRSVGRRPGG